jgi:hypothetical protein
MLTAPQNNPDRQPCFEIRRVWFLGFPELSLFVRILPLNSKKSKLNHEFKLFQIELISKQNQKKIFLVAILKAIE